MQPNIRKFPSLKFYDDRLIDSKSVKERKFPPYIANLISKNILFFDIKFSKESMKDYSYYNSEEARSFFY